MTCGHPYTLYNNVCDILMIIEKMATSIKQTFKFVNS